MKIIVVEPNGTGGLSHYAHQLCRALAQAGVEVVLITSTDYELSGHSRNFRVEPTLRLWPIHGTSSPTGSPTGLGGAGNRLRRRFRRIGRGLRFAMAWQGLVGQIRAHRPDAVIFSILHFPFQWLYLAQLRLSGILLTQICHEFEGRDTDGRASPLSLVRDWMFRRAYATMSAIMFLSRDTQAAFQARFPGLDVPTHVIPHGTQDLFDADPAVMARLRAAYGILPGEKVILFFGTVRPSKGLPDLIDAYALLPDRSGTRLVIAGFPNKHMDVAALKGQVARLGLIDRVVLDLRYLPNGEMGSLVSLGDITVFPYLNATQSGALYLAYSFARPIIATRVGGLAEDLVEGQTGLSVPPADPTALSHALARLLADGDLAARLGAAGQALARSRNGWADVARAVLEIQAPLLAGRAAVTPAAPRVAAPGSAPADLQS